MLSKQIIYLAGGCLWGVQEFLKHIPGIINTQAGRANGTTKSTKTDYDGFAECVKTTFDSNIVSVEDLINYLLEIIDPYSINKQGNDIGQKYRTGIYSNNTRHLLKAKTHIKTIEDNLNKENKTQKTIAIEVLPLTNFIPSDTEHQDRLTLHPEDYSYCHIPLDVLHKYKNN
ncbi:peptide-methionine (S)-S-oxide reductase [Olleya aquimaris]|uniref:Peptide methionine sulfoxide reductase MsrA n=1 Tax=Olleya sediminilitoris TaxID=2795739 RepID=A0ABS1WPS2_9FLAO|nr:peptide-methionine (S)-S-oxide reductase [Olleya sediminilitoris]AXO78979.1 peptide-methionine (S)-S-oxide reductase [Olleya aquimaris]MBL7561097.1 peptide-methionine (S)-S-oxide reductase [Olleya sediminilitoris]